MKSRKGLVVLALLVLLAVLVLLNRDRVHFDWTAFWQQVQHIAWTHIAIGVACIYATYWLRSARWAVFLSEQKKVPLFSLVAPQFIGFAAVALFGRIADVIRPVLVARRVDLPASTQYAVYTIERMFDLGAAALIFSGALLFIPRDLPHHNIFVRTGVFSLVGTLCIAAFAVVLRAGGSGIAELVRRVLGGLSRPVADSVADKIQGFRDGLNAISSVQDFVVVTLVSLLMWVLIGVAYVQTLHAFTQTPQLASISFSRTMLLMGASIGGSLLQLPIIGWFTQIALTATAMHEFYDAPVESATACGAMLLFVTFLSILPTGLIFARIGRVNLRATTEEAA